MYGSGHLLQISRVGHNCISAPYMTVCMVISLLKIPYVHRIYLLMYGSGQPYIQDEKCSHISNIAIEELGRDKGEKKCINCRNFTCVSEIMGELVHSFLCKPAPAEHFGFCEGTHM